MGWDTPPPAHHNYSICMEEGSGITKLQSDFSYLHVLTLYSDFNIYASLDPVGRAGGLGGGGGIRMKILNLDELRNVHT